MSATEIESSPEQLSFAIYPWLSSIEGIASEHGLHHDSGVSFSSYLGGSGSSIESALQQGTSMSQSISLKAPPSSSQPQRFLLSSAASTSSLSKQSSSQPRAPNEDRSKRVMESPGVTGSFDAREDIWGDVARKLKPFGDILRHERLRTTLGSTSLSQDCADLLQYSSKRKEDGPALHDAQIEMLRILANLCIDHEENRDVAFRHHAPQAVMSLFQQVLDCDHHHFELNIITLLRMGIGALNNMQLNHPSTREALRHDKQSIEILLQLATDARIYRLGDWYRPHDPTVDSRVWRRKIQAGSYITTSAWQLVQEICADDAESSQSKQASEDEETEKSFDSIVCIGAMKAACYFVRPMEPFAAKAKNSITSHGPWDADDVSDLIEADIGALQCAAELFESCSLDSKEFRIASLADVRPALASYHSVLAFLVHFVDVAEPPSAWSWDRDDADSLPPKPSDEEGAKEAASTFARAKAAVARAVVSIVGEDENMATLFEGNTTTNIDNWFINTMKQWMERNSKDRDDLVSTAMLAIGNLARKDSHCIALVHEHGLVPSLTSNLIPETDIKVSHATVCLLKNLAIPPENKRLIGQSNDLLGRLTFFLSEKMDKVQPLQFAAVGLLKHLCASCIGNAVALSVRRDALDELLCLLQRTDDVPTRMEGTRALVTTIKSLWSASPHDQAGERNEAKRLLVTEPVISSLSEMVRGSSKYPVLVNEGILALTLLASEEHGPPMVSQALLKSPSVPEQESAPITQEQQPSHALDHPLLPQRQTTLDSLASNTSPSLPVIRSAADMVLIVLSRRDARMPPHFASNACALVQTLVQSSNRNTSLTHTLIKLWIPALQQLSHVGPQETVPLAQKALQSAELFVA